jgi:hypothetical protein
MSDRNWLRTRFIVALMGFGCSVLGLCLVVMGHERQAGLIAIVVAIVLELFGIGGK